MGSRSGLPPDRLNPPPDPPTGRRVSPAPSARCGPPTPLAARSNPEQENHMIACVRCDDTNGPFSRQPEGHVCEKCLDEQDGTQ